MIARKLVLTDEQWRERLTDEQYLVLRRKGTEPAFCGGYSSMKKNGPGTYYCAGCDAALFTSEAKFDSGTGWPSFFQPLPGAVESKTDTSHGMVRTEVHCARCDGHLGHLFTDGLPPNLLRYCINAVALAFRPAPAKTSETATFAAGCFWGVEEIFRSIPGVIDVQVGYTGGHTVNPTYHEVCEGTTGHAEAVEVTFDPKVVSYERLLGLFWANHDPTTTNRQGPDVGNQYRSAVFYHSPAQLAAARAVKAGLEAAGIFHRPIVTEIVEAGPFYRAEEYHQRYNEKHGAASCHVRQP
jgi:peptide methionine sulfoxide reductase msrA/msrB